MKNEIKKRRAMKNDKQKNERTIYAIGRPNLEKLTQTETKVFYDMLLFCITEYYKNDKKDS